MSVLDEIQNMKKYYHLRFIEWLDMLCRITIVAVAWNETIDYKTHLLLEIIYERMYKEELLDRGQHPLRPPEDLLRC